MMLVVWGGEVTHHIKCSLLLWIQAYFKTNIKSETWLFPYKFKRWKIQIRLHNNFKIFYLCHQLYRLSRPGHCCSYLYVDKSQQCREDFAPINTCWLACISAYPNNKSCRQSGGNFLSKKTFPHLSFCTIFQPKTWTKDRIPMTTGSRDETMAWTGINRVLCSNCQFLFCTDVILGINIVSNRNIATKHNDKQYPCWLKNTMAALHCFSNYIWG